MPKATRISQMEDLINRGAVSEFYEDSHIRDFYLDVLHSFVLLAARDKKTAESDLQHPIDKKSIFDVTNSSNEAFIFLVLVNNVDGWNERIKDGCASRSKKCVGRWTKIIKNPQDTKNHGRLTNCSGWSDEGLAFYKNCKIFFASLRDHESHEEYKEDAITYYFNNYEAPRLKNAKNNSRKRQRASAARAHEDAPDYAEMQGWA